MSYNCPSVLVAPGGIFLFGFNNHFLELTKMVYKREMYFITLRDKVIFYFFNLR